MKGMDYLLHIASPLSVKEGSIIDVAKKGTENVIGAAVRQGVPKIVMTSSGGAAVPDTDSTLVDENVWTSLDNPTITDYYRRCSKCLLLTQTTGWQMCATLLICIFLPWKTNVCLLCGHIFYLNVQIDTTYRFCC